MTRHRSIVNLRYAVPCERPAFIPISRPRGSKGAGLRYERAVAKAIPHAQHSPWFFFIDANGQGHCNPDLLIDLGDVMAILECKLTDTWLAYSQIGELYAPVVREALGKPTIGLVVAKNCSPITDGGRVVTTLAEGLRRARNGEVPLLHWLGRGAI